MKGYVARTADEIRSWIGDMGFVEVKIPGTFELVFERSTNNSDIRIRVYSSIANGESREVGKDAGRVLLIEKTTNKPVWKSKRVNRTENFLLNLRKRCRDAWHSVAGLEKCPVCKGFMIERKSKNGKFLGCLKYPGCKGTRPLKGVK